MNRLGILSILLLILSLIGETSYGQVIRARESFTGHIYYMAAIKRSGEVSRDEGDVVAGVRTEMKQFIKDSSYNFDPKSGLGAGEFKDYCRIDSELRLTGNGEGLVVLTNIKDSSLNRIFSRSDPYKTITSVPKRIELFEDTSDPDVQHDPSLTVDERRLYIAAPSVTLARYENYFLNPHSRTRELFWIIEKSLDHRFPIIWITRATIVSDTVVVVYEQTKRTIIILGDGIADNTVSEDHYKIQIKIEFLDHEIRRVKYDITSNIVPSTSSYNANLLPAFTGQGRFSLEVEREQP